MYFAENCNPQCTDRTKCLYYGNMAEVWYRWMGELNFPNLKSTKGKNTGRSTHSGLCWVYYNYFKTHETIPDM